MARGKNYQLDKSRLEQVEDEQKKSYSVQADNKFSPDDALIDILALIGPKTRIGTPKRYLDLREWLGRGIDPWVRATVICLKAMLRSGKHEVATVASYCREIAQLFSFLIDGRKIPRVAAPVDLSPLHIEAYVGWLKNRATERDWSMWTARTAFNGCKAILVEMLERKLIPGEKARFFKRGMMPLQPGSDVTSLSDAEQERMARAIKTDLSASYHGRLLINPGQLQALRLLVVAHRQGKNTTPMLELNRNSLTPGAIPGTISIRTVKQRGKKIASSPGRDVSKAEDVAAKPVEEMLFDLSEAAVLQQAISSTADLVDEAPERIKDHVWLYRSQAQRSKNKVTRVEATVLYRALRALVTRHGLLGDNGKPLQINLSRLRKSFWDRSFRINDGDIPKTAIHMGNSAAVAGTNYPSMNDTRKSEAAIFMNESYTNLQRGNPRVVEIAPVDFTKNETSAASTGKTPVSSCSNTLNGEYAPRDGHNHCDRYVMCLFCHSFVIVGTVEELWRLFSFQAFARSELEYLEQILGPERTNDEVSEDLRVRYRLVIPYIDDFTQRQFPIASLKAREKTEDGLHPFWIHQMSRSRSARSRLMGYEMP